MTTNIIPILLVTGFLGSGKTTFINWLIHKVPEKKISLILNEFGDIKLESQFIKKEGIGLVTELANGCMCCVAKSDIPRIIHYTLENAPQTEQIVIEASGLSDPDPLRKILGGQELSSIIYLDTVLCVVDAVNFETESKTHSLVLSQIGDADLILLSKTEGVSKEQLDLLVSQISSIGIGTKVILWDAHMDPVFFLNQKFSPKKTVGDRPSHIHENIHEYWYTTNSKMDINKVTTIFQSLPKSIIRAKGYLHTSNGRVLLQYVGTRLEFSKGEVSEKDLNKTAILLLGTNIDEISLTQTLDSCKI